MQIQTIDFEDIYRTHTWHQYYKNDVEKLGLQLASGVNGFCSVEAQKKIKQTCTAVRMPTLTFLGSGNYHYLTYFLLQQIKQPFSLVLFDFHSDMQGGFGDDLLSCGNWVSFALHKCPNMKQVFICGVNAQYIPSVTVFSSAQVICFTEEKMHSHDWLSDFERLSRYPVYVSIDKDVFSTAFAYTNWDQGSMDREMMESFFDLLYQNKELIGGDICGELSIDYADLLGVETQKCNDEMNKFLIKCFKEHRFTKKKIC